MRPGVVFSDPWRFPLPETHDLDHGMTVWAFHLPGQHVVAAELVLDCGVAAEPADLEGLATITAHTCDEGTLSHPDGRIAEVLESHGALVSTHQGHYTTQIRLEVPSTRLLSSIDPFVEIIRTPQLSDSDVALQVDNSIARHASRLSTPRGATSLAFRQAMYLAEDRRTRPEPGTPATLRNVTGADVRSFQQRLWGPSRAVLVIAGDLPSGTVDAFAQAFSSWSPQQPSPDAMPRLHQQRRVLVVDRPHAVQADVMIGTYALGRTDPRLAAAFLAGQAMAGAFSSRLNRVLREERAFTYGVHGGFMPGRHGGVFTVSGSFRVEVAAAAISVALELLGLTDGFTETEIALARHNYLGVAPLAHATASDIVDQAARLADGRTEVSYLHRLDDQVLTVTADQADSVFRELVRPAGLHIVLTGPAHALVPALASLGLEPEVIDLSATG